MTNKTVGIICIICLGLGFGACAVLDLRGAKSYKIQIQQLGLIIQAVNVHRGD